MKLEIFPCNYKAVKYACTHWHYSKSVPAGKMIKFGVWEEDKFIGCVIYSLGANNNLPKSLNLHKNEVLELTRIALNEHETPVTQIVSKTLKAIKERHKTIKMIVSYADADQSHKGKIYQAGNWIYLGLFGGTGGIILNGKIVHRKTIHSRYGTSNLIYLRKKVDPNARAAKTDGKHKYIMPLDKKLRKIWLLKAVTPPK